MSLEKIEKYIKELQAIKNYDTIKSERDTLQTKLKELEKKLSSQTKKLEELLQAKKNLEGQVKEKTQEISSLKKELKTKDQAIKDLEENLHRLKSRVNELEKLKAFKDKTLEEAEKDLLKAKEEEIKKRAQELFAQMKSRWEKGDKPKEVQTEAVKLVKHIVKTLSRPEPRFFMKEAADAGLPEEIEEIINSEVEKRLNAEFNKRVEERAEQISREKLEQKINIAWPHWHKTHVEPKIRMLETKIMNNAINALKGPWTITCDKCGTAFDIELTPQGIEEILRQGYTEIECQNPWCTDFFFLSEQRHKIKVTLRDLIEFYIQ